MGAPALNMYLDKLAEEHPEFFEKYHLAQGGDVNSMAKEIVQHHLESKKAQNKPKKSNTPKISPKDLFAILW